MYLKIGSHAAIMWAHLYDENHRSPTHQNLATIGPTRLMMYHGVPGPLEQMMFTCGDPLICNPLWFVGHKLAAHFTSYREIQRPRWVDQDLKSL